MTDTIVYDKEDLMNINLFQSCLSVARLLPGRRHRINMSFWKDTGRKTCRRGGRDPTTEAAWGVCSVIEGDRRTAATIDPP